MIQPIAEIQVPIKLGDTDYVMVFNANTMVAYEQATGKFFLRTVAMLMAVAFPKGLKEEQETNPWMILSKVSMIDLRALLWAALHNYDSDDNPKWPLTITQVGRLLQLKDIVPTFNQFLKGQAGNNPKDNEMGESPAEVKTSPDSPQQSNPASIGERGIALPVDVFDSPNDKLAD